MFINQEIMCGFFAAAAALGGILVGVLCLEEALFRMAFVMFGIIWIDVIWIFRSFFDPITHIFFSVYRLFSLQNYRGKIIILNLAFSRKSSQGSNMP